MTLHLLGPALDSSSSDELLWSKNVLLEEIFTLLFFFVFRQYVCSTRVVWGVSVVEDSRLNSSASFTQLVDSSVLSVLSLLTVKLVSAPGRFLDTICSSGIEELADIGIVEEVEDIRVYVRQVFKGQKSPEF